MKFPHPCGEAYADAASRGADPRTVIPDDHIIVHGGITPIPPPGAKFSGAAGPTLEAAAVAVPHGKVRATTAGAIRGARRDGDVGASTIPLVDAESSACERR